MCQRLIVSRVRGLEGSRVRFLQGGEPSPSYPPSFDMVIPQYKNENATQNKSFDVSYSERARNFRPGVSAGARGIVYAETQGSLHKRWLANDLISRSAKQIFTKEIAEKNHLLHRERLVHVRLHPPPWQKPTRSRFPVMERVVKNMKKKCGRYLGFASTTMV